MAVSTPRSLMRAIIRAPWPEPEFTSLAAVSNDLEHRVHIGPAGWHYEDWDGIFYPVRRPRGFDALDFVASYFTLVEINSTFYRVPPPATTRRWVERVRGHDNFRFTIKAHQALTHRGDPARPAELEPLQRAIEPVFEAGRLGALLLQFPWSFRFSSASRRLLDARLRELAPCPVAVELRHGSWESAEAQTYLASLDVAVCGIDQPVIGESVRPYHYRCGPAGAYFRLHGRNYRDWFREDAGRDARYDYLYATAELSPWAEVIRRAAGEAAHVFVVLNNHFRGQAPANAFELSAMFYGRRVGAPARLRRAYPQLEACTTASPEPGEASTLFDD
jgi:uncharacterized protein YecE (DUF72 family)